MTYLFKAYNAGMDLDLLRISKEMPRPTKEEWAVLSSCEENCIFDIMKTSHRNRKFLNFMNHRINMYNSNRDAWGRCMVWYFGLRRSGYPLNTNA